MHLHTGLEGVETDDLERRRQAVSRISTAVPTFLIEELIIGMSFSELKLRSRPSTAPHIGFWLNYKPVTYRQWLETV